MIKFEDFYFASKVGMIDADTGKRIDANMAEKYSKEGYIVKEFEPMVHDFMIRVWVEKGEE